MREMSKNFFVHDNALCETERVGEGTRIWAFAHVLPGASIGTDCNICDHVFIENDVRLGNSVTVKCGVQLWDGVEIGDQVFIGPNVTFTNDRNPRSKVYPEAFLRTIIEDGASIGANATILPGVRIGRSAMVGAGAVVLSDVPANATVVGNPARIVGYQTTDQVEDSAEALIGDRLPQEVGAIVPLGDSNCFIERLPQFQDIRGGLTPLELNKGLPFLPKRVFLVYSVGGEKVRGEHAHKECAQFLIAANGSLSVMIDDGQERIEVSLTDPTIGLYLAPKVWGVQYKFSRDAVLLVAASHNYDADDYIRDYDDFLAYLAPN